MIFQEIDVDMKIVLELDLEYVDDCEDAITLCNKFVIRNENLKIKKLLIDSWDDFDIDIFYQVGYVDSKKSFNFHPLQHLIGEMMAEIELVEVDGPIFSGEIMVRLV